MIDAATDLPTLLLQSVLLPTALAVATMLAMPIEDDEAATPPSEIDDSWIMYAYWMI